jgi:hypothetical protein
MDSAGNLLPAHGKRLLMTMDEIIERALKKAGIFPPSVLDSNYGDKTEMSRAEIIVKSLEQMSLLSLSEHDPRFAAKVRRIQLVVAMLQLRLPDGEITTCGAFRGLGVGCCNICHKHPLRRMRLVELPGCNWGWLCCAVDAASSPEPYLIFHEREQDPPVRMRRTCKYRNGGGRED